MKRFLTYIALGALAFPTAHAAPGNVFEFVADAQYGPAFEAAKGDKLLTAYVQWASLRDPKQDQITFDDGYDFLSAHGDWPEMNTIRLRTEQAALDSKPDAAALKRFCTDFPPISGRGMFACAAAGAGIAEQSADWIHQGWLQGDFTEPEEAQVLATYGQQFTSADHIARIDRLLFEGRVGPAKRMLPRVPRDRLTLYMARIALITNSHDANFRMDSVPVNLRRDPGLLFDRIGWRHRKGDDEGVAELFTMAPKNPPFADLWWPLRAATVRDAVSANRPADALQMLENQGELKSENKADALFLRGWVALSGLHDTRAAYKDFYEMYTAVGTPVSKARAAYWAAEAAVLNGNPEIAREWQEKAASRPTTFYGQLAYQALHPGEALKLPDGPSPTAIASEHFKEEEQVKLIRLLAAQDQKPMANRFLVNLANSADSPERFLLIARLAREVGETAGGVRAAKLALRKGVVLLKEGWPLVEVPADNPLEPALALSIIRQESEFDPAAESNAGARGLMQLLPGTAKQMAHKAGMAFSNDDLWKGTTNIELGSAYLAHLIAVEDNSYIMGIAAYNAGPGNVSRWQSQFGRPGKTPREAVDWIERIPFSETRNYVMRNLENLQVYRTLLNPQQKLALAQDLLRAPSAMTTAATSSMRMESPEPGPLQHRAGGAR